MGFISEVRSSLENPQTPLSHPAEWLLDIFNGGRTDSGIRVSEMTALQVTTIFACCEIKAGAIGALHLKIFEKQVTPDGRLKRVIAHDHDYWDLLEHQPNPEMSAFTLKKTLQVHRMLWGNCYAEFQRDRNSRIVAIWPRNPARMRPHRLMKATKIVTSDGLEIVGRAGQMVYVTTEGMETESMDPENPSPDPQGPGGDRYILPEDILHIPGLSLDGRIGQDVIQLARNAVGLALATEKFAGKFFGNGAVGRGMFMVPGGSISNEDRAQLVQELLAAYGGENIHRPMLLDGGLEYKETATKPNEAQFLETREHQVVEICRIFTVPPHMVGVTEKTSRANTEQIGQEFLTFSLSPDLRAWEQEVKRKMLPPPERGRNAARKFGVFFDTFPLVTPSASDQRAYYQAMIQWGILEPNDVRELMQMNPLDTPGADSTWMQINMAPVDQLFKTPALPGAGEDDEDEPAQDDDEKPAATKAKNNRARAGDALLIARVSAAYSHLFSDAFGRVCRRSQADEAAFKRTFAPVLISIGVQLQEFAEQSFDAEPSGNEFFEDSRFLTGYLSTMFHRYQSESWPAANGSAKEICKRELQRAIRAFAIEAFRAVGTAAAKLHTEVEADS